MAIAVDSVTTATASAASAISLTHTASGADRAVMALSAGSDAVPVNSTATYAGVSMTEHWDAIFATFWQSAGYSLAAPATGAQTVTATYSASQGQLKLGVITLTGVDQTTPTGTAATATGNSTTPSVAVTSAVDELVVDGLVHANDANATPGAGQTERYDLAGVGAELSIAGSTEPGAASVTMDWTIASNNWHVGAIPFKPAAAAAGATHPGWMSKYGWS